MFKGELGLLLDNQKQCFRTSIDENFSDLEFFLDCSRIAVVNVELIKRLIVILEAIINGYHIDKKSSKYMLMKQDLHGPITPTMYKVLIIRVTVIQQVEKYILASCHKKLPRPETNTLGCTVRITP
ncbi:hypothetical protein AVEN_210507-1 [Araneus ventricosus]|uniref:Uncharacterized protein n=1 Tax=Araneus ventricosus TaxID=182803 RepID=A0A4Y2FET7_ARAVE|nr:hypothetical protein AVEN_210507-1 [Araneus ventricosus]